MTVLIISILSLAVIGLLFYIEAKQHNESLQKQLTDNLAEMRSLYAEALAAVKKL